MNHKGKATLYEAPQSLIRQTEMRPKASSEHQEARVSLPPTGYIEWKSTPETLWPQPMQNVLGARDGWGYSVTS